MTNEKRSVEFLANDSKEAKDMKKSLEEKGLKVNHIYSGSSVPILIDNGLPTRGAGNIRTYYSLKN